LYDLTFRSPKLEVLEISKLSLSSYGGSDALQTYKVQALWKQLLKTRPELRELCLKDFGCDGEQCGGIIMAGIAGSLVHLQKLTILGYGKDDGPSTADISRMLKRLPQLISVIISGYDVPLTIFSDVKGDVPTTTLQTLGIRAGTKVAAAPEQVLKLLEVRQYIALIMS
jgi:hypothetical protein